jgi:hypothetical protein
MATTLSIGTKATADKAASSLRSGRLMPAVPQFKSWAAIQELCHQQS